ncbi:MAG: PAN domain-containing protein [Alphaproteobacteria bacterium]
MIAIVCAFALWILGGAQAASANEVTLVEDLERQGTVYDVRRDVAKDPERCRAACAEDERCVAFTYYRPPEEPEGKAHCWLQDTLVPAWTSECCVSGVKSGAAKTDGTVFADIGLAKDEAVLVQTAGSDEAETPLGLDLCLDKGFDCGWPVAHAFCTREGLGEAVDYIVERSAPPTRSLRGGPVCTGEFCHRIRSVTCASDSDGGSSGIPAR